MQKTSKDQHKNMKRREFKNISDILEFEHELLLEGMTDEEKNKFGILPMDSEETDINYKEYQKSKYHLNNYYYKIKDNVFIYIKERKDAQELLNKKEILTYADYLKNEINKRSPSLHKEKVPHNLDPIIFQNKGKTPPSVPYLQVMVTSDVEGDIKSLHQIHSKVRK